MNRANEIARLIENCYEVSRMMNAIEKNPKTYHTDYVLYSNEVHTLKAIAEQEGISQKELTARMLRTKGATSSVIDKLVKKGLVRKEVKEEDQRVTRLFVTEEGWKVHEAHMKYDMEKVQQWMGNIGIADEKLAVASEVLERFTDFYRKNIF